MDLFKLFGTIAINNADANKALDDTTEKAKTTKEMIEAIRTSAIKIGTAFTGAATAIGGALVASVENTREYREQMNMLETAFYTSGHSAESARQTYSALHAVLGETGQAVEAANHIAKLVSNTREMETWTNICTGVWATFGESLPLESLTEASNETAKVGQVVGTLADALNWMGVSEDEFNEKLAGLSSEQERQRMIMETLDGLYKDATETYKENNAEIMAAYEAQDKLTNAFSNFGEKGEPILTKFKNTFADLINVCFQWICDNGEAVGVALGTIATGIALGAIAAHPYAVAIMAVAAGLAALQTAGSRTKEKLFTYSDEDLATLQRYVDAVNAAKEAETAYFADEWSMADSAKNKAWLDTKENLKIAEAEVDAIDGLMESYKNWLGTQSTEGIYLDVPLRVSEDSSVEMQSAVEAMVLEGEATINASSNSGRILQSYLNALDLTAVVKLVEDSSGLDPDYKSGADGSHASGLERVPFDGYRAILHRDEAVLTASEAAVWRSGGMDGAGVGRLEALMGNMIGLMQQMVANTGVGQNIVLDTGILVGEITPRIDERMGSIASRKGRRN